MIQIFHVLSWRQNCEAFVYRFTQLLSGTESNILARIPHQRLLTMTADSIRVRPSTTDSRGCTVPGRFDTALVCIYVTINGSYLSQATVLVVFSIAEKARNVMFSRGVAAPQHLIYIEWYTPFSNHFLYKISPLRDPNGGHISSRL